MPEDTPKLSKNFNLGDFSIPTYEEWREKVVADLRGANFEKRLITKTFEGIDLKPLYIRKDLEYRHLINEFPGFPNYIRGSNTSGYISESWEISQEITVPDANDFNAEIRNDLSRGQTAVNLVLDSATELGIDADYSEPEYVGDKGLSLSGLKSFSRAVEKIDLQKYAIYIQPGFSNIELLGILSAYLKTNNIDFNSVRGSVEADPISFMLNHGGLPVVLPYAFDKMKIATEWALKKLPGVRTVGVNGSIYHDAGASGLQELAYSMASAIEYIEQLKRRGLDIDQIAGSIRFTFGIGSFYFMEIAKFRAARILWSNLMKYYGASENASKIVVHGRTSRYEQTYYDPYVNILRSTTAAFSAIIGGIDSLHTSAFSEAYSETDRFARRIARNTQIILRDEAHLDKLIDPAGGSYFVESLTMDIAEAAWNEILKIEEMGGMLEALKKNYPQQEIDEIALRRETEIRKRKKIIVGTNMYANPKEEMPEKKTRDISEFYRKRAEFLQKYRVSGDTRKHKEILEKLHTLADPNSTDILDIATEAFLNGATIGEISSSLRSNYTENFKVNKLLSRRAGNSFETLRIAVDEYSVNNPRPKVLLAAMGSVSQYKARADFSRGFFEIGGFEVIYPEGFAAIEDAIGVVKRTSPEALVICSTDDLYPELAVPLTNRVKELDPNIFVILAGYPKEQVEHYRKSGIDDFIFLGADAYDILSNLFKKIKEKRSIL